MSMVKFLLAAGTVAMPPFPLLVTHPLIDASPTASSSGALEGPSFSIVGWASDLRSPIGIWMHREELEPTTSAAVV
jgi:hypothetical protein